MFCQYCGAQIPDGSAFCSACGSRQQIVQPSQQPQRQEAPTYQQAQPTYQQAQPTYQQARPTYQQPVYQQAAYQQPMPGMKWHKFICYFALWLSALTNLYVGITYMGSYYSVQKIYGGFAIVIAVLCIITALKLIRFKHDAPKTLHNLLLLSTVGSLAFTLWSAGVFSGYGINFGDRDTATALASFVLSLVIIMINKSYYNKRAYLFTR